MENGLWLKTIFFASSSHSYMGKSVIQQNRNTFFSTRSSSSPSLVRQLPPPMGRQRHAGRRRRRCQSPGLAPLTWDSLPRRSPSRNFAIGPRCGTFAEGEASRAPERPVPSPMPPGDRRSSAAAPAAPGPEIARTTAPREAALANNRNPEPAKTSLTSAISRGFLRSGLSVPYVAIASSKGMRGNGAAKRLGRRRIPRTRRAARARWRARHPPA